MRLPRAISPMSLARMVASNRFGARLAGAALTVRGRAQRKPDWQAAREASDTLTWLGSSEQAERVLDNAIKSAPLDEAALLRCRVEVLRMNRTHRPLAHDRTQALAARALARLDSRWALADHDIAGELTDVLQLLFHGEIHLADQPSPLLDRDADWLAPLKASKLGQLLLEAGPVAPKVGRPDQTVERCRRLAFITQGSRTFLDPLIAALDTRDCEIRVLDIAEHPELLKQFSVPALVARRLARARGEQPAVPKLFAEIVAWADTVHAEWGTTCAAMLSMCDAPARKVVRVHAFETRTLWMPLIDWANIDQAVFVSAALARMCVERYPAFRANPARVLHNISELDKFVLPKTAESGRTLAMIGWNLAIKDPAWCLDLFEQLHSADASWRLQLIGHDMAPDDDYRRGVLDQLNRLGELVERVPFSTDVPGLLTRVGVIVSSSLSEGAPLAVAEGAASGALPVVRNWPALAAWGGPREVYPDEWVVDSPAAGAQRILQYSEQDLAAAGAAASEWILANRDPEVVAASYLDAYFPAQGGVDA